MHEIYLLREVLNLEPYKYKQSSGLRGKVWTTISDNLKSNTQHEFKVSQRSCREKFQKVMDEFNKTCNEEERATGVDVDYDEYKQLCEDIKERIQDVGEEMEKEKQNEEEEKALVIDIRSKAMETLVETNKRKKSEEDSGKKSTRRKTGDTLEYLKQCMEFKTKQLDTEKELREKEIQLREAEHKQQQQQQNMQNQIMMQVLQNQNTVLQQLTDVIKTKNT